MALEQMDHLQEYDSVAKLHEAPNWRQMIQDVKSLNDAEFTLEVGLSTAGARSLDLLRMKRWKPAVILDLDALDSDTHARIETLATELHLLDRCMLFTTAATDTGWQPMASGDILRNVPVVHACSPDYLVKFAARTPLKSRDAVLAGLNLSMALENALIVSNDPQGWRLSDRSAIVRWPALFGHHLPSAMVAAAVKHLASGMTATYVALTLRSALNDFPDKIEWLEGPEPSHVDRPIFRETLTRNKLLLVCDLDQTLVDVEARPLEPGQPLVYEIASADISSGGRRRCLFGRFQRRSRATFLPRDLTSPQTPAATAFLRPGLPHLVRTIAPCYDFVVVTASRGAHPHLVEQVLAKQLGPVGWRSLRVVDRDELEFAGYQEKSLLAITDGDRDLTRRCVVLDDLPNAWAARDQRKVLSILPYTSTVTSPKVFLRNSKRLAEYLLQLHAQWLKQPDADTGSIITDLNARKRGAPVF